MSEMFYHSAIGIRKYTGLMFRTRKTKPLSFDFKTPTMQPIHSYFVFFPFRAIWLDDRGEIIDTKIIKPFTFSVIPSKPYKVLLEIPII